MNGCCGSCREYEWVATFPGVLTRDEAAAIVADHPGMAVSLGGLAARVVWAEADSRAADGVAEMTAAQIIGTPSSTNAPGQCFAGPAEGAHINITDPEGIETVSHPNGIVHADTRQGRQATAALAIAKMCEHQLPEIGHWVIGHDLTIRGTLRVNTVDPLAALTEWAVFIARGEHGVPHPVVTSPMDGVTYSRVSVHGVSHGVPVEICFDASPDQVAELDAESEAS